MTREEILRKKGRDVVTIAANETVLAAVRRLVEHDIGSLVVVEDGRPVGIVTERDVLRLAAGGPGRLGTTEVADVMTREMITAAAGDGVKAIMDVMTEERIRHLPVLEVGRLVGIVSIGDVVNACRASAEDENRHLRRYIQGVG
jgi:CBS domain-containing protein